VITCRLVLVRQLERQELLGLQQVLHQQEQQQVLERLLELELALPLLFCHKRLK
jgi:hypothetical protein